MTNGFAANFHKVTDRRPYPWQTDLYVRLCSGDIPSACVVPTGLGKTSVIPIWFLARLENPTLPRRLVYVVNRRTVVDQTTDEVTKLREKLPEIGMRAGDLAISTLRGQFADNREWSADPSRPAVICGTVDMIGSRLLFNGYGVGFKGKPLHAGFIGQDVLLVHDEAHLEEPFQSLAMSIERMQAAFNGKRVAPSLRVMALTATPRGTEDPLRITNADREAATERLDAAKRLELVPTKTDSDAFSEIVDHAHALYARERAVLIFVRTVEGVKKVIDGLKKKKVSEASIGQLTGTIRGKERDELVRSPVFKRFLPNPEYEITGPVYLVCTSAGEVGVNISADDLVCDLAPFDSMAQRFGRVNRFGRRTGEAGSTVTVVHPTEFNPKGPLDNRREKTLKLLRGVQNVSPNALEALPQEAREDAFTPTPDCLPLTDILMDAWSLTSVRTRMPGRPEVVPFLRGIAEHQAPEARVAWREEVGAITPEMFDDHPPRDLLEAYELKPHELLKDTSRRVFQELRTLAERFGDRPVWLLDEFGHVDTRHTLETLTSRTDAAIRNCTVLLPHDVGGLNQHGMLDGDAQPSDDPTRPIDNDVADDLWLPEDNGKPFEERRKLRVRADERDDDATRGMRLIRTIRWLAADDAGASDVRPRVWYWFERPATKENSRHALGPVTLDVHVGDVERTLNDILNGLSLDPAIAHALRLAARWHDLGKRRELWQGSIGRPEALADMCFAKSGRSWVSRREGSYRHEFGSLLDVTRLEECAEFRSLDPDVQDLVLHVIASHHGMARPHFDTDQTLDEDHPADAGDTMAVEVMRRFARLQRRFGHWGLAYIESILRAADWHASASPSEFFEDAAR